MRSSLAAPPSQLTTRPTSHQRMLPSGLAGAGRQATPSGVRNAAHQQAGYSSLVQPHPYLGHRKSQSHQYGVGQYEPHQHNQYPRPFYPKINGRWMYPSEWKALKLLEIARDPYKKFRRWPRLRWSMLPTPLGERKNKLWWIYKGHRFPRWDAKLPGGGQQLDSTQQPLPDMKVRPAAFYDRHQQESFLTDPQNRAFEKARLENLNVLTSSKIKKLQHIVQMEQLNIRLGGLGNFDRQWAEKRMEVGQGNIGLWEYDVTGGQLKDNERNAQLRQESLMLIHALHTTMPQKYTVDRLATIFRLRPQRIIAIIALQEQEMAREKKLVGWLQAVSGLQEEDLARFCQGCSSSAAAKALWESQYQDKVRAYKETEQYKQLLQAVPQQVTGKWWWMHIKKYYPEQWEQFFPEEDAKLQERQEAIDASEGRESRTWLRLMAFKLHTEILLERCHTVLQEKFDCSYSAGSGERPFYSIPSYPNFEIVGDPSQASQPNARSIEAAHRLYSRQEELNREMFEENLIYNMSKLSIKPTGMKKLKRYYWIMRHFPPPEKPEGMTLLYTPLTTDGPQEPTVVNRDGSRRPLTRDEILLYRRKYMRPNIKDRRRFIP